MCVCLVFEEFLCKQAKSRFADITRGGFAGWLHGCSQACWPAGVVAGFWVAGVASRWVVRSVRTWLSLRGSAGRLCGLLADIEGGAAAGGGRRLRVLLKRRFADWVVCRRGGCSVDARLAALGMAGLVVSLRMLLKRARVLGWRLRCFCLHWLLWWLAWSCLRS